MIQLTLSTPETLMKALNAFLGGLFILATVCIDFAVIKLNLVFLDPRKSLLRERVNTPNVLPS